MEGLAELERRNASGPEAWMQEGAGADETLEAFVVRRNGVGGGPGDGPRRARRSHYTDLAVSPWWSRFFHRSEKRCRAGWVGSAFGSRAQVDPAQR